MFRHDLFEKSGPEPGACEAPNRIKDAGYRRKQEGAFERLKKAYQPIDIPRKYAPSQPCAGHLPQALRILGRG
jgi:hypothetical protein